jgi:hypothetical protein
MNSRHRGDDLDVVLVTDLVELVLDRRAQQQAQLGPAAMFGWTLAAFTGTVPINVAILDKWQADAPPAD